MACYAWVWNLQALPRKSVAAPLGRWKSVITSSVRQFNQLPDPISGANELAPAQGRSSEAVQRAIGSAMESHEMSPKGRVKSTVAALNVLGDMWYLRHSAAGDASSAPVAHTAPTRTSVRSVKAQEMAQEMSLISQARSELGGQRDENISTACSLRVSLRSAVEVSNSKAPSHAGKLPVLVAIRVASPKAMRRPRAVETDLDQDLLPDDYAKADVIPVPVRRARSASTASASGSSASSSSSSSTPVKLDWNSFFQLRKTRRRFQLASSIVTMAIGGTGGALLLVNMNMDWLLSKVPMDPIFALGIITLSFAGLGWLSGPSVGSAIFYTLKRGVKRPMAIKESEFFNRIKKNRVDPSNSSLSGNAVPDFYGEKISSVAGYRQWLKDQRAFNKKRTSFV
ncbi:hypothetical protein CHU98_g7372 [Xylaria longipes]|nr:hypothetical protein CHU98_g7372 [Xylaria longipes]